MKQVLKKQRVKHLIISLLALTIVISPLAVLGTPSYSVSVIYSEFNVATYTEHTFPSEGNYTLPWSVVVTNKLTYNETTDACNAKVRFQNGLNISEGVVDLQWFEPTAGIGTLDVYVSETDTGVKVGSLDYETDEEWTVNFASDGITLLNESGSQLEYNFNAFDINNVSVTGIVDAVTAGFVQLDFSDTSEYGLDIISAMLPLLVTLTMFSVIIKSVNKLGKG